MVFRRQLLRVVVLDCGDARDAANAATEGAKEADAKEGARKGLATEKAKARQRRWHQG